MTALRDGSGVIAIERVAGRSAFVRCEAASPLRLLVPDVNAHASWCYVSSFGGGLVDGDRFSLDVTLGDDARLVLATQASTKIYRGTSSQALTARVGRGALLAVVPDPVVPFAEARYAQRIAVDLAETASLALVDAFTAGRSARGERWDFARYESRLSVTRGGAPVLLDPLLLAPDDGALRERMHGFDALATVVLLGPASTEAARAAIASATARVRSTDDVIVAASPVAEGALVRIAGREVAGVTRAVRERLAFLAPLLGEDPWRGRP